VEPVRIVVPGAPVPKGRPRFTVIAGHVSPYTPKKTRDYEFRIKQAAVLAMRGRGGAILTGPVSIRIMVNLQIPVSWPKWNRRAAATGAIFPTSRPDLDNFGKVVLDALNGIVFVDDSQVTDMIATKRYSADPGLILTVAEIALAEAEKGRAA
jgi:Holliday junction resolvase RusA-like endonuclease